MASFLVESLRTARGRVNFKFFTERSFFPPLLSFSLLGEKRKKRLGTSFRVFSRLRRARSFKCFVGTCRNSLSAFKFYTDQPSLPLSRWLKILLEVTARNVGTSRVISRRSMNFNEDEKEDGNSISIRNSSYSLSTSSCRSRDT